MAHAFPQSIVLCMIFAVLAGVADVLSAVAIAIPEEQALKDIKWSKWGLRFMLFLNLLFQLFQTITAAAATFFGPISIALPTQNAANLTANLVIFGGILKHERVTKDSFVGTYIVVATTVLLVVVGPQAQDDQDVERLVKEPWAAAWLLMVALGVLLSGIWIVVVDIKSLNRGAAVGLFLVLFITTEILSNSASKAMVLLDNPVEVAGLAAMFILSTTFGTYGMVVQASVLPQTIFWPIQTMLEQTLNAVTGLIVWEDWRVVVNWAGYGTVFLLFGLGVFLVSDFDLPTFKDSKLENPFARISRFWNADDAKLVRPLVAVRIQTLRESRGHERAKQRLQEFSSYFDTFQELSTYLSGPIQDDDEIVASCEYSPAEVVKRTEQHVEKEMVEP